jgi:hypothetical protein
MNLESRYYDLTHGWHGIVMLYVLIAVFSLAGLRRGRAGLEQYFFWPFSTMATLVVVGLLVEFLSWALSSLAGVHVGDIGENALAIVVYMFGGFLGGLYWAKRGRPLGAIAGRGAMVLDGAAAQAATTKLRVKAQALPPSQIPLTVAGIAVGLKDEVNHFKFMGTTGTGKSTVMRELLHAALYRGDRRSGRWVSVLFLYPEPRRCDPESL